MLRYALLRKIRIASHHKLWWEYRDVLRRMQSTGEIAYSWRRIERLLAALAGVSEEVEVRYLWRPNLPDESDNFVFEVAFAASPATIVTHNIRDFRGELLWSGVLVKTPREVLMEMQDA